MNTASFINGSHDTKTHNINRLPSLQAYFARRRNTHSTMTRAKGLTIDLIRKISLLKQPYPIFDREWSTRSLLPRGRKFDDPVGRSAVATKNSSQVNRHSTTPYLLRYTHTFWYSYQVCWIF